MERKEPTLSNAALDVLDHRESSATAGAAVAKAPAGAKARAESRSSARAARSSGPSSFALSFSVLMALAALAGSGLLAWQLQQAQGQLVAAAERITVLEQKLDLAGDESTQSVTAIRAKLKWADAEIRKLWGVSYDTNRKSISGNKATIAKLKKQLGTASKAASSAKTLASGHQGQLDKLKQQVSSDAESLSQLNEQTREQQQSLQRAVDKVNQANRQLALLKSDLAARVASNEEAIEAIDAYRRNINRDLLQLQQRLNQPGGG